MRIISILIIILQSQIAKSEYALYDDELRFSNIVTSKIVDPKVSYWG